jgi:hypothetical protein
MAGKGDRPRSCFSSQFKSNYDTINWSDRKKKKDRPAEQIKKGKKIYVYSNSR